MLQLTYIQLKFSKMRLNIYMIVIIHVYTTKIIILDIFKYSRINISAVIQVKSKMDIYCILVS